MIEKGRHMGLKPEERMCPFCPNAIEDEMHFLLDCQMYREIRAPLVREAERLNYFFKFLDREQKFKHFLIDFSWNSVANVIFKCFELRDFFISKSFDFCFVVQYFCIYLFKFFLFCKILTDAQEVLYRSASIF